MLDDVELFTQLCNKHGLIPESDIVDAVKLSGSTGELKLSHTSIIAGLCEIIAQVLSSSSTIKLVDLSDCMLLAKGLNFIFKALREGSSVTSIYLKGNNISGPLVEQLGQVLSNNNVLKIMHVEWNNLGSQIDSFAKFCDGLAKNHHIEELDLRYNQISTLCADYFAKALKQNKSLKRLDLAWNSLGMSGGQKILQGVQHNRFLIALNLKGNCVPSEINSAIKQRIAENQKRLMLCETPIVQIHTLFNTESSEAEDRRDNIKVKLRKRKKKKRDEGNKTSLLNVGLRDSPVGDSGNDDDDDDEIIEIHRSSSNVAKTKFTINNNNKERKNEDNEDNEEKKNEKVQALSRIIQERSASMDLLQTELIVKDEELISLKAENEELKLEIQKLKEEKVNLIEDKTKETENATKSLAKAEENWKESYNELEESYQNLTRSKQEIENRCRILDKELRKVNLELSSIKDKNSIAVQNYEDSISDYKVETHRLKRELLERENRYKIETGALKESLKETQEALEKCQEQLQKLRNELRESIEQQARWKMKIDEAERFVGRTLKLEDALNKIKEEKEKLEEKLQESRRSFANLQKQIIKVQEEAIEPQKMYEAVKLELHVEKERTTNVKVELQEERTRMKEQNEQLQKMIGQINGLYAQLGEVQSSHAEVVRNKDVEIEKLKAIVAQKSREFDEFRSEQVQKAHLFQAAVNKYFGSFGST